MKVFWARIIFIGVVMSLCFGDWHEPGQAIAQGYDSSPPAQPVKLIFIHHSTGENWLTDGYGNLGRVLADNNYFVSDTNYGWGPDSIGDNTDIPNWVDWFRSDHTPIYMDALFIENGQLSNYTRTFDDPGGENVIIMFKSCFPNSDLEGNPDDHPDPDGWLSVGHAKYVYNEILQYFATRPDKLFVVITAPPLSDNTNAANARAFNNWLVTDWLSENQYTLNNVAVFDFYNVLTSPDAHHQFLNGDIVHIVANSNTLAYPTDDDHPSEAGSQKATEEFVPLLNYFYHRWHADAPLQPPLSEATATAESIKPEENNSAPSMPVSIKEIDNFETTSQMSSGGWQAYWDETTATRIACAPTTAIACNGARSLQINFDVAPEGWATCELQFDDVQNWASAEGLYFNLYAGQASLVFNVDIMAGDPEGIYSYSVEAPSESINGWVPISLRWEDFHRVEWEENAGSPLDISQSITGIAFGFNTYLDTPNTGTLWMDDLQLNSGESSVESVQQAYPPSTPDEETYPPPVEDETTATPERGGGGLPCGSSITVPLAAIVVALSAQRKRKAWFSYQ